MRKVSFIELFFVVTVLAILIVVFCFIFEIRAVVTSFEKETDAKWNDVYILRFLNELSTEISQPDRIIDQETKAHIVKRIAQQKEKYKNSNLPKPNDLIVDHINFLMNVKDELSTNECAEIENLISEEVILLRFVLLTDLGDSYGVTFNLSSTTTFPLFYMPANLGPFLQGGPFDAMSETEQLPDIMEAIWPNGCRKITYGLNEAFPPEKYILDTSSFYADTNFVPLDYDLCMPRSLAGLKGGWNKSKGGNYWTQFWENDNGDVINVNISHTNQNHAIVTVVFVNKTQAIPLFDFYYNFHKPTGQEFDNAKKRMFNEDTVFQRLNLSE